MAVAPKVAEVVVQFKVLSMPASAVGTAVDTFTTTASVAVQPEAVFVTVTVYVAVTLGVAVGFETVLLDKPVSGDHA